MRSRERGVGDDPDPAPPSDPDKASHHSDALYRLERQAVLMISSQIRLLVGLMAERQQAALRVEAAIIVSPARRPLRRREARLAIAQFGNVPM